MVRLVRILREKEKEREWLLHSYELRPINLFNLNEKQASSVLDRFIQFLKTLTDRTVFRIIGDERRIDAGGEEYQIPYKRYFVSSTLELGDILPFMGSRFSKVESVPELKIVRASSRYMWDKDG
jgi:hypothetical protein